MIKFDSIQEFSKKAGAFQSVLNGLRLVDPAKGKAVCTLLLKQTALPFACYEAWKNETICSGCLTAHALEQQRMILMVGGKNNGIFLLVMLPVEVGGHSLVLEAVLDATGSLYFESEAVCQSPETLMQSVSCHMDRLITTDHLTGLYNRRFIDEQLPAALESAARSGSPFSVIYADIDLFKTINDRYGHNAGDQVLKGVAALLQENIRQNEGWAARYGGDEFLVCLPGVDKQAAKKVARRLRSAIAGQGLWLDQAPLRLTCSFGVYTAYQQDHPITIGELIARADQNLYLAKRSGRNQVK